MTTYYDLKDASESCYEKADRMGDWARHLASHDLITPDEYRNRCYQYEALQRTAHRLEKHAIRLRAADALLNYLCQFNYEKDAAADQLFADEWQAEVAAQQRDSNEAHQMETELRG